MTREKKAAPGQFYAKRWVIYAALGIPDVDIKDWKLEVTGMIDRSLQCSFEELQQMPSVKLVSDFHCVTGWSIADVEWEGVPFLRLAQMAGVKQGAEWVTFRCVDGYSAPVPLEDVVVEDSIIAFKMNGKSISREQGFPARPFIPPLYGWKSAKWLTAIELLPSYKDGYWEAYSYHERGNIWEEGRFKGQSGKHSRRRTFGTVPV